MLISSRLRARICPDRSLYRSRRTGRLWVSRRNAAMALLLGVRERFVDVRRRLTSGLLGDGLWSERWRGGEGGAWLDLSVSLI